MNNDKKNYSFVDDNGVTDLESLRKHYPKDRKGKVMKNRK